MKKTQRICIEKVANGYILQGINDYYSKYGDAEIYPTYEEAILAVSENFNEEGFGATLKESQELSRSLSSFFRKVVKPELLAIEAKINPGVENIVQFGDE